MCQMCVIVKEWFHVGRKPSDYQAASLCTAHQSEANTLELDDGHIPWKAVPVQATLTLVSVQDTE